MPDVLPASAPPNPLSANLGSSYRFPSLMWTPVTWVDRYNVYITRPGGTTTQLPDDFSWNAGDDLTGTYLDPGTYTWYVVVTRVDGSTLTGSSSQFTILPLPDIRSRAYQAALNGNALTGNGTGQVDTCNLKLPSNCQNLRADAGARLGQAERHVGYYSIVFSKDAELTNSSAARRTGQHDVHGPGRAGGQPGRLGVLRGVLPCTADGHCASLTHADTLVQQADPAGDPRSPHSTARRCRTTSR